MPEITTSREIDAAQATVWALVSNPQRFADWNTLHLRWEDEPPAELTTGAHLVDVVKIKGIVDTIAFTVDEIRHPEFLSLSGSGSTGSTVVLDVTVAEQSPARCVVTLHIVFTSSVLFGPLGRVIEKAFRKQLDASLDKLAAAFVGT